MSRRMLKAPWPSFSGFQTPGCPFEGGCFISREKTMHQADYDWYFCVGILILWISGAVGFLIWVTKGKDYGG